MTRKISYISGSRADFGLMKRSLDEIDKSSSFELEIIATGMHLMESRGKTIDELHNCGLSVVECPSSFDSDTKAASVKFISNFLSQLEKHLRKSQPDILLLLGDRPEMLAGAIAGRYMGIPIVHIHGGDVSSNVDDSVRHSITKLSDIHMAATDDAAERIKKMGEAEERIFVVGAPGVESIRELASPRNAIENNLGFRLEQRFLLLIVHPQNASRAESKDLIDSVLEATKRTELQVVALFPNADAGSEPIIEALQKAEDKRFKVLKHIERPDFLGLMRETTAMIGNSSSGIIEAASFDTQVVNVGSRQKNRVHGKNVIDANAKQEAIRKALESALSSTMKNLKNPYELQYTSKKIAKILSELDLKDIRSKAKQITY